VTFPIFDADGDLVTGSSGRDSEISKDGGAFIDCTNEAVELAAGGGIYYLDVTDSEMNADTVAIIVKTTSTGAKTTPIIAYPVAGAFTEIYSDTTVIETGTASILAWDLSSVASDTAAIESELILVHSETTAIQTGTAIVVAWGLGSVASDTAAIEVDTGNIYSDTTIIYSDTTVIHSETTAIQTGTAIIAAWGLGSVASDTAAIESELILVHSETTAIQTGTAIVVAWGLSSVASDTAAIESELILVHSETTAIQTGTAIVVGWGLGSVASDTAAIETDTGNIYSDTTVIEGWGLGSVASDTAAIETETGKIYSDTTIIYSDTTAIHSETTAIQTGTAIVVAWGLSSVASDTAAIESELILVHSETTAIQTGTAIVAAWGLGSVASDTAAIETDTSNIYSDTTVIEAWGLGSVASDTAAIESELILVHSETLAIETGTASILAAGGGLTPAQASDLAAIESELILVHSETTEIQTGTASILNWGLGSVASDTAVIEGWGLGSVASDTAAIESELILVHSETTAIQTGTASIADTVWDEVITGATHNIANSAGRRLRELGAVSILSGTAVASTSQTVTLDTDASTTADIYNQNLVVIIGGTGAGQSRLILEYTTGRVATVDRTWEVNPAADSEYQIIAFSGILLATHGTAQAGGASTITLATSALAIANSYVGCDIYVAAGAGVGQTRLITAYTAGRVATVSPAWDTQPGATSVYKVLPVGRSIVESLPTGTQASIDAIESELILVHSETTAIQTGTAIISAWDLGSVASDAAAIESELILVHSETTAIQTGTASILAWNLTLATMADAVWDESLAGHTATGTAGAVLADAGGGATPAAIADAVWDESITGHTATGTAGALLDTAARSTAGAGAITFTYTLTSSVDGAPIVDADVWVTADAAGSNVLASGTTDSNGQVVFYLDAGTVYVWRQMPGWNFDNPDTEVVA
jgi:hypothetical protein